MMLIHTLKVLIILHFTSISLTNAKVSCVSDVECEDAVRAGSKCVAGVCTNPFMKGCLNTVLGDDAADVLKQRVCNSDDQPDAEANGLCTSPHRLFNFTETRINPNNWESAMFFGWVAQIVLSEVLGVPATIETAKDASLSFYDVNNSFPYPKGSNNFDFLIKANELAEEGKDCSATDEPCAHFMPEVWVRPSEEDTINGVDRDSNGLISGTGWYIPMYTLKEYPFLASYVGLQDEEDETVVREKLAQIFKRPATWKEFCEEHSCTPFVGNNTIATRPPKDETEGSKYYAAPDYMGYFRATQKNDCTNLGSNAASCSGHMIDYPCTWLAYTDMQIYWNNLGLETDIEYSYSQMIQVFKAAKHAQEHVLIQWWYPTPESDEYFRVTLPQITNECLAQRPLRKSKRCEESEEEKRGLEGSGCDYLLDMTDKFYAKSFLDQADDMPVAEKNPSALFLKKLQVGDIDINEMLKAWDARGIDRYGYDGREAVCEWVARNLNEKSDLMQYVPRGYPRKVPEKSFNKSLSIGTIVFGAVVSVCVMGMTYAIYAYRKVKVIKYAQPQFCYLFCAGYLFIAFAAILYGIQPSDGICIAREWLVLLGYSLGNVPLLVKTAAINTLMQHAKKMKRVQISQKKLFGIVGSVLFISIVYLVCWTTIDPSMKVEELILVVEKTGDVELQVSCDASSSIWTIVAHVWETFYILCSSVLAVQSRNVVQKFNESKDVGNMAYVSFLFLIFRLLVHYIPSDVLKPDTSDGIISIILSLDAVANLAVYFGPKFYKVYKKDSEATGGRTRYISGLSAPITSLAVNQRASNISQVDRVSQLKKSSLAHEIDESTTDDIEANRSKLPTGIQVNSNTSDSEKKETTTLLQESNKKKAGEKPTEGQESRKVNTVSESEKKETTALLLESNEVKSGEKPTEDQELKESVEDDDDDSNEE